MGRKSRAKRDRAYRPANAGVIVAGIREHLAAVEDAYPDAWRQMAAFRRGRDELGGWPSWCWVPLAGAHAVVTQGGPAISSIDSPLAPAGSAAVATVGALAAWRQTQTIYRYDPALSDALADTDLGDRLPPQAFYRLPEWCVYVALPEDATIGRGFFAHLEWDITAERPELRLLIDPGDGRLTPLILYLNRPSISQGLTDVLATTLANAAEPGVAHDIHTDDQEPLEHWRERARDVGVPEDAIGQALAQAQGTLHTAVSTLLYLCAQEPDISEPGRPQVPWRPTRTVGVPSSPRVWEVGHRIGAALTRGRGQPTGPSAASGRSVRPHVRRAHWHSYWTGPRDGPRTLVLRWLHPITVATDDQAGLIPTIRPVTEP